MHILFNLFKEIIDFYAKIQQTLEKSKYFQGNNFEPNMCFKEGIVKNNEKLK